ncbi:MAG: SDR family NAD(P)-dependent oxidoreductase [Acidimicrobiales bacterium]
MAEIEQEDHLDILVNNAGVSGAPIESFLENGWDKVMDTNVKWVFSSRSASSRSSKPPPLPRIRRGSTTSA